MKAIRKQNIKIFISAIDITDNSLDNSLTHGYQISMKLYLTFLLRNLYGGQEAIVRTGHGTTDSFQNGKGVHQGCILSPCLFNLNVKYITRNAMLDEAQAGIKIARRYVTTLDVQMIPP